MKRMDAHKRLKLKSIALLFMLCASIHFSFGQSDLKALLDQAEKNYPSIAVKKSLALAARENISLEKNKILPSLDAAYQANYATYSNVAGLDFPGTIIPISGPPTRTGTTEAVPGNAASLITKWEPFTFGQRSATIQYTRNLYEQQLAGVEDEVLKIKFRVAFAYLEIASVQEFIKAYQKNNERNEFNLKQITTLVQSGIRPAVDSLKFKGELSKTRSELIQLENQLEVQRQELQELLSQNFRESETMGFFFEHLPALPANSDSSQNPSLKIAHYELEANKNKLRQINLAWTPKLEFWGTTFARGSGVDYTGTINKAAGWNLNHYNYGLGIQLILPILDFSNFQMRSRQQNALLRSSENNLQQVQLTLNKQQKVAYHTLLTSLQIAEEIPAEYEASESAYKAVMTRYKSGIVDYSELIQSQYDLLNAEAKLKKAYVDSWKSLLALAVIKGDLSIFLNQIP